jgi:hypothetical protein
MANDATDEFVQRFATLLEDFKVAIWREAFKAGGDAMRDTILRAAQAPIADVGILKPQTAAEERTDRVPGTRAPRGAVGRSIDLVLEVYPGSSIPDIEEMVARENKEIARKSVGNEIRRMEGKKYKRDRPNGYRWFLIDHNVNQEVGEPTPPASASDIFGGRRLGGTNAAP